MESRIQPKVICLSCGDYYPRDEVVSSICIWCSVSARLFDIISDDACSGVVEHEAPSVPEQTE